MPTVESNGARITYWDSGGSGPVLLLSHGFLMDHTMFDPQVRALVPEFRVVTWDERAFGQSRTPGPFSYWDSAADAFAVLDHLGVERAVLGGMSQGGFLSLRAALSQPERVRALVLLDTEAGVEDPDTLKAYDQLRDVWMAEGPGPVQDVVAALILGPGAWPDWLAKWAALDREQFALAYQCLVERDDVLPRLGEITCPALVVHGTDDAAIAVDRGEKMAAGLGGPTRLVKVPGGTHAANLTHPEVVNAALVEFLRSLPT